MSSHTNKKDENRHWSDGDIELQQKAIIELNEDPTRVEEDINTIKEWAKKEPNLKIRTDDQWILSFLRWCKFSHEKTKEKLKHFYETRVRVPEFFSNRNPMNPDIQEILSLGILLPLKLSGPDSPFYILIRCGHYDPQIVQSSNVLKVLTMIADIMVNENDNSIVVGTNVLKDFTEVAMSHLFYTPPMVAKKSLDCLQHVYPMRIKEIHNFNVPSFFDYIFSTFKPFLTQKILDRIHVYGKESKVFDSVPKELLPKEYGGTGDTIAKITDMWKKKVESYKEWFEEDFQYKSYGPLKTDQTTFNYNDLFGVFGSFKTINVD